MRVPLSAIWPPIVLFCADLAVMPIAAWLSWWLVAPLVAGAAILVFDIRGRMSDFRLAVRHFTAGRRPERVAENFHFSWCGRVACASAAAAVDSATGKRVADYYFANGYRWYHIFPDGTFTLNSPFLKLKFWRVTVFGNAKAAARLEEPDENENPPSNETEPAARSLKEAA